MSNLSQYKTDISQYATDTIDESNPIIIQDKIDNGVTVQNKTLSTIADDRCEIIGDLFFLANTLSGASIINLDICKTAMKSAYEASSVGDPLVIIFGIAAAFWSVAQFQLGNPLPPIVSETSIVVVLPDIPTMSAIQYPKFTPITVPGSCTIAKARTMAQLYAEREAEEIWYYYVSQIRINSYGLDSLGIPTSVLDQPLVN